MNILIIQTAFIGDVILLLPLVQKLKRRYPDSAVDVMVRKGNESVLLKDPRIRRVIVWDKKHSRYRNLIKIIREVRRAKYDYLFNLHRFFSSGMVTLFSGAKDRRGFDKNPLSGFYTRKFIHRFGTKQNPIHEVDRNLSLLEGIADTVRERPEVFIPNETEDRVRTLLPAGKKFAVIAPASVWFTKQFPAARWVEVIQTVLPDHRVYLTGSPEDFPLCENIRKSSRHPDCINLCAKDFGLLESACLMKYADRVYVNDSAPLHLAGAVNAKVSAVFCSTVPAFGFFPLSDDSRIIEIREPLPCRPCGLHGFKKCPEGHFKCAENINTHAFHLNQE